MPRARSAAVFAASALLSACAALFASPASADEPRATKEAPAPSDAGPRLYGNLRVGGSLGGGSDRPELCGEVAPLSFLSVEACGTGSGFLHHDPTPETAHFRAKLTLLRKRLGPVFLEPQVGLGLAEVQVGEDDPGFQLGGTGPRGVETAGPEALGGVRVFTELGLGLELVGELSLAVGYTPHAPELVRPQPVAPVFLSASAGVGF